MDCYKNSLIFETKTTIKIIIIVIIVVINRKMTKRDRNKAPEGQVMHSAIARQPLTSPQQWFANLRFIH